MLAPLALPWIGAVVCTSLAGRHPRAGAAVAGVTLLGAATAAAALVWSVTQHGPLEIVTGGWPAGIGIRLRADALGAFFAAVSIGVVAGSYCVEWASGIRSSTFPPLALFLAAGLAGLFLTGDVFNFYVFFEVAMIASFALAAYGGRPQEVRAATVFAIVNLVGTVLFLGGVASLYRYAGTLDFPGMAAALEDLPEPVVGTATVLFVALGLKLGLFPFHFWLPAVYRGTRPSVAAMLSGAVANIGSYGLLRFGVEIFPGVVQAGRGLLIGIAVATILYGGVLAASRRTTAEVLGYSAVGQGGYVLLGLAVGGPLGLAAAALYAGVNGINKGLLFLTGHGRGPLFGAVFALGAFSVAGMPPTPGFAGKVELLRLGVAQESAWLLVLVVAGAALSFVYMFQSYQHVYWVRDRDAPASAAAPRRVLCALAAVVVLAGLWPEPLLVAAREAARTLGGGP